MKVEKQKYYVNVGTQEISQVPYGNNDDFTIYADEAEVYLLRKVFNGMHDADQSSFWRTHIPFKPYHNDSENDAYDAGIVDAYRMLYQLGDDSTRNNIKELGIILEDKE
ncbi:hydrolase [Saliterribacillus persicus]|uniref:Hydrolase n=1 Tax=Saliterribacillus persicus TaxID=930114 RepID=A0A368XLK6_9BACI|nr:hydrolase [Saliterribacillus persicus]RCW66914.1 hypothetical protein DFR57_1089 [Saliterribacillus persicus]